MAEIPVAGETEHEAEPQQWVALFQVDVADGKTAIRPRVDGFFAEPGIGISECVEMALPEAEGALIAVIRADRVNGFLAALRDHAGVSALIHAVGKYAAQQGEAWRVGGGVEIMDAYQAVTIKGHGSN